MKRLFHPFLALIALLLVSLACGIGEGIPTETPTDTPTVPPTATVMATPTEAPKDPFTGSWISTDIDGSSQTLVIIEAGGVYTFEYYDDGASICGLDSAGVPLFAASASGTLTASGSTLSGDFSINCLDDPPFHGVDHLFVFTYDPATETMTDDLGVVWER
jgi:hypothetical protein